MNCKFILYFLYKNAFQLVYCSIHYLNLFAAFSTQISTILITAVTFSIYYVIEGSSRLTAVNIFAGLAFFNQLTAPLLILPVTVQMIMQAVVSKGYK